MRKASSGFRGLVLGKGWLLAFLVVVGISAVLGLRSVYIHLVCHCHGGEERHAHLRFKGGIMLVTVIFLRRVLEACHCFIWFGGVAAFSKCSFGGITMPKVSIGQVCCEHVV